MSSLLLIHTPTGEYPIFDYDLRARHPHTSFPSTMTADALGDLGYAIVTPTEKPATSEFEYAVELAPVQTESGYVQAWQVATMPSNDQSTLIQNQKQYLLARVSELRYEKETSGFTLTDGTVLKTDRESQATVAGAAVSALLDPAVVIKWKAASGWVDLHADAIKQIALIVSVYVRACFEAEKAHLDAISALPDTMEALRAYDLTTGWPVPNQVVQEQVAP